MDMGSEAGERAALQALIDATAPRPVPASQAIAALRRVAAEGGVDAETLGRLAYHALTGTDPGPAGGDAPPAPADVAPGFPPFAAEVLMRAILGPAERRPTPQALAIVLDTVPVASWPSTARAVEPVAEAVVDPVVDPVVGPVVEPVSADTELESETGEPDSAPVVERAAPPSRASLRAEFRRMLSPSHEVPRFDPLTAPLDAPDRAPTPGELLGAGTGVEPEPEPEPLPLEPPDPIEPPSALEPPSPLEPPDPIEPATPDADDLSAPDAAPDEPTDEPINEPTAEPTTATPARPAATAPGDRKQTLLLVGVLLLLVLAGALYAALREDPPEPERPAFPQGASLVISHALDVRV